MKKEDAAGTTTLSARFDEREMVALRQAADAKQWSLSQLIRSGAYEKAVNVLNAQSPAVSAVRRLLCDVVQQLFEAKVMIEELSERNAVPVELTKTVWTSDHDESECFATTLQREKGQQLIDAMRKLGAELAGLFADEMMRLRAFDVPDQLLDPALPSPEATDAIPTSPPAEDEIREKGAPRTSRRVSRRGGRKER